MSYEITKVFKLDMGHRTWSQDMRKGRGKEFYSKEIPYPYNKCANLHGHSLLVSVHLVSPTVDEQNFVVDTDLFKVPFQKIIDKMDHAFIIDKNDPLFTDIESIAKKENLRLYIVNFSPSFEGLAKYFYECMEDIVNNSEFKEEVRVHKTMVTGEHMTVEASYSK